MEKNADKGGASIIELPAFKAVGMRWEGTFAEAGAGGIRRMQEAFKSRVSEIEGAVRPAELLGLSYHAFPGGDGFIHYAAVEVQGTAAVPDGMATIEVPAFRYARCEHRKGTSIDASYRNLYDWIERQGYAAGESELTHFEIYPMAQDPYDPDPAFVILIPVSAK